jgi:hypothetical protein
MGEFGNRQNGRFPALPPEVENEIAAQTVKAESFSFGMTITDCMKLAYGVAAKSESSTCITKISK